MSNKKDQNQRKVWLRPECHELGIENSYGGTQNQPYEDIDGVIIIS